MDKKQEILLILEATSEYFYTLIEDHDRIDLFTPNENREDAHEEADFIIERLEGLLDEAWH